MIEGLRQSVGTGDVPGCQGEQAQQHHQAGNESAPALDQGRSACNRQFPLRVIMRARARKCSAKWRKQVQEQAEPNYYVGKEVGQAFQPDRARVRLESLTYVCFFLAGVIATFVLGKRLVS